MIRQGLFRVGQKEAGNVAGIDGLDQQLDACRLQFLRRKGQVFDKDGFERGMVDALRGDARQTIDLAAVQRLCVVDGLVDASAELVDPVRQDGNSALTLGPVAGRQVEQNLRQAILLELCRNRFGLVIVRRDILDALKTRVGSGVKAMKEIMLAEEHGKIC